MDDQPNALRGLSLVPHDSTSTNADVNADVQPPDLAEAGAEYRLALLDYDLVDWSLAANTSIRNDRVVSFVFDRTLATMPSRTPSLGGSYLFESACNDDYYSLDGPSKTTCGIT